MDKKIMDRLIENEILTVGKYNTTIDLYVDDLDCNSLVIDEKDITKKTNLTTADIYALRYVGMNLYYHDDKLTHMYGFDDNNNAMQNNELQLNDFEGCYIDCINVDSENENSSDENLTVTSVFLDTNNNLYCTVWIGGNSRIIVKIF